MWITENTRTNVDPAYIFLTSVRKYVNMFSCKNVFSIWDKRLTRGIKNYRRLAKRVEYKGTRDEKKNAQVFSHEDKTTELLQCLGVKNMYPNILEADDVISWLSNEIPGKTVIVSVDQDMLQLIREDVMVYSPIKDVIIDHQNFEEIVGVPISQFLRYKSLMGDKSDNLPGLTKCGPKTAKKYVTNYPDDQLLVENLGQEKLEPYFFNKRMIDLKQGLIEHPEEEPVYSDQYNRIKDLKPDFDKFISTCRQNNMNNVVNNEMDWRSAFTDTNIESRLQDIVNSLEMSK